MSTRNVLNSIIDGSSEKIVDAVNKAMMEKINVYIEEKRKKLAADIFKGQLTERVKVDGPIEVWKKSLEKEYSDIEYRDAKTGDGVEAYATATKGYSNKVLIGTWNKKYKGIKLDKPNAKK